MTHSKVPKRVSIELHFVISGPDTVVLSCYDSSPTLHLRVSVLCSTTVQYGTTLLDRGDSCCYCDQLTGGAGSCWLPAAVVCTDTEQEH